MRFRFQRRYVQGPIHPIYRFCLMQSNQFVVHFRFPILAFLFFVCFCGCCLWVCCVLTSCYFLVNRFHWLHRHDFSFSFPPFTSWSTGCYDSFCTIEYCAKLWIKYSAPKIACRWMVSRFDLVSRSLHTITHASRLMAVSSHYSKKLCRYCPKSSVRILCGCANFKSRAMMC